MAANPKIEGDKVVIEDGEEEDGGGDDDEDDYNDYDQAHQTGIINVVVSSMTDKNFLPNQHQVFQTSTPSCKLCSQSGQGDQVEIARVIKEEVKNELTKSYEEAQQEVNAVSGPKLALVIDGKCLMYALDPSLRGKLLNMSLICYAAVCCRVSPLQKAQVAMTISLFLLKNRDVLGMDLLAANDMSAIFPVRPVPSFYGKVCRWHKFLLDWLLRCHACTDSASEVTQSGICKSKEVLLKKVQLILEAFDYLQLPFTLNQGRIGRLSIKIPWKKLSLDPINISLENVFLRLSRRPCHQWSLDVVQTREFAAKKA
ncbi:hypothetical protein ACFE04_029543 [Oxalis oulophora]